MIIGNQKTIDLEKIFTSNSRVWDRGKICVSDWLRNFSSRILSGFRVHQNLQAVFFQTEGPHLDRMLSLVLQLHVTVRSVPKIQDRASPNFSFVAIRNVRKVAFVFPDIGHSKCMKSKWKDTTIVLDQTKSLYYCTVTDTQIYEHQPLASAPVLA
jgi:hypothetical protein